MVLSLRDQLLRWLLPVLVLALLLATVAVYMIVGAATADSLDEGLLDAARRFAQHAREHPEATAVTLPPEAQRVLLVTAKDRLFFSLRDAAGHSLAGDVRLAEDRPWGSLDAPEFFDLGHDGYWLRAISVVFEAGGQAMHLVVATTSQKREELVGDIMLGMVAPQLLLLLVAIALVWAGVRQGLAPLVVLRDQLSLRSHVDLRPLDESSVPSELQAIVVEVNRLLARLERAMAGQRHFIADAAHQLRTPIAGLLAQIEADNTAVANPAVVQAARRLARLVAQLLALSRAEPGVETERQEFDLAALIRDAAHDWLPQAFRREADIGFELAAAPVVGSPHAWREMLANLVDNALRYGRPAGNIVIRCAVVAGEVCVQVDDDGPGIPVVEREKVFERFYRSPAVRAEGCGLGLAIVRALAEQQGARVKLDEAPGGGLRVELRAPRTVVRESGA
jgi:two-component system, OmpR family, sensor histidine kinase TctE